MDDDNDSELVTLLLQSKIRIWEDKKRLGLLEEKAEKYKYEEPVRSSEYIPMNLKHGSSHTSKKEHNIHDNVQEREKGLLISRISSGSPCFGHQKDYKKKNSRSTAPLASDLQSCQKDEFISKLTITQGLAGLGEKQAPKETEPMVRFGEFSPQNPSLLSPGKTLLGLGEYEEKRRQILERKKREYLEQMAQARQAVKDTVSGRFGELNQQHESPELNSRPRMITKRTAGTQTDFRIRDYVEDAGYSPPATYGSSISPLAATHTPGGEISVVLSTMLPYPQISTTATQTSGGNLRLPEYGTISADIPAATGIIALPQQASYLPLSPRERKMAEFRESYSPSFLQGHPLRPGGFDMTMDQTPDVRRRRETYQEELRRQIEEKQRIDAEQQKKAQEEEEAITRRAELQQERMRQEYVQEEALRRERHLQRMRQAEEFQRRQEALKLEAELIREAEARQRLEKRLEDLEAGLAQHTSYSTQSLGVSLPVPVLGAKYLSSGSPKEATPPLDQTASPLSQDLPEEVATDSRAMNSDTESRLQSNSTDNKVEDNIEQSQRGSNVEHHLHNRTAECILQNNLYSPQINNVEHRVSDPLVNLPKSFSDRRKTKDPITISYHRPPIEIIKAAGYGGNVRHCDDVALSNDNTDTLDINRHSVIPLEGGQHISSLQTQDSNKCKKNLDDSLPIPILRIPSPVIPAVKIGQAASGSDAMSKLEAKWQVPAVEKNVLHTNSNPNNILTQLGAVRHQLQLEQMRMEQHLQQRLKNKS